MWHVAQALMSHYNPIPYSYLRQWDWRRLWRETCPTRGSNDPRLLLASLPLSLSTLKRSSLRIKMKLMLWMVELRERQSLTPPGHIWVTIPAEVIYFSLNKLLKPNFPVNTRPIYGEWTKPFYTRLLKILTGLCLGPTISCVINNQVKK